MEDPIVKLCLPQNFSRKKNINNWSVYILQCSDKTYYTGITNNLEKRLQTHNSGKGARYTSGRLPVVLVYKMGNLTENQAKKTEFAFKKLSRKEKEKIIHGEMLEWLKRASC